MDEKLIRDALGSPVPQHYNEELDMFTVNTLDGSTVTNGDIDFSQTKLLRDRLGSVIPQVWDAQNHKWVVVTTQNTGDNGGGETGPVVWDSIQGKPFEFTPSTHTHEISEINGLQDRLDEVFQQVSSGKSLLETAVVAKGSVVDKAGNVATFEEIRRAISAIANGDGTPKKHFSDDYPLPLKSSEFTSKKGYAIIQYPNEIRLYAINDCLSYDKTDNTYSAKLKGWSKWHLVDGTWVYIESDPGLFGSAIVIPENFIELSHHAIDNNVVTFLGRLGHFDWYKNL